MLTTEGYIVYNTHWKAACAPWPRRTWAEAKVAGRPAISDFDGNKSAAFVYHSRKAAQRAIGRAVRAGYFRTEDDFQIIRIVRFGRVL